MDTLAASISEETETIEDVYEPYLMQIGFLERTPRGRTATEAAYKHLGIKEEEQRTGEVVLAWAYRNIIHLKGVNHVI